LLLDCSIDCLQEHFFAVPEPGKLAAKINWRINKPNGDFIERSTIQVRRLPAMICGRNQRTV
jgi:hypothetical protein